MKPTKRVFALLAACTLAAGLSGCSISDLSADSLLRPPKAVGDEAEIEELIADTAQNGYTLKYPKSGSFRSAIITTDLDGDESPEAVAFFKNTADASSVHMLVMYASKGSWLLASEHTFETADIDSVDFADINGDSVLEIIVSTATYASGINNLSCCAYLNGSTSEIDCSATCSSFVTGDFDGDNASEIMALTLYTTENEASAAMLDYNSENTDIYTKASVNMDPSVASYKNISVTKLSDTVNGAVIDGVTSSGELNTQAVYYNKELSLLRNPLYREKSKNTTQRTSSIVCSDVNSDGKLEIPVELELPSENDGDYKYAEKIEWNSFDCTEEKLVQAKTVIINCDNMFMITLPDKWNDDNVTAIINSDDGITSFYEWNDSDIGNKLFEIQVSSASEWETGTHGSFTLITKDDRYAYSFRNINTEAEASLTDDEIKTSFSTLVQSGI